MFKVMQTCQFFEIISDNVKFSVNVSINKPRVLKESLDIMTCLLVKDPYYKGWCSGDDGFIKEYRHDNGNISSNVINVRKVKNKYEIDCIDPWLKIEYHLVFEKRFEALKQRVVRVGRGRRDLMIYDPRMCSAVVNGTITVNGNIHEIRNAIGYHDWYQTSANLLQWQPWLIVQDNKFQIICFEAITPVNDGIPSKILAMYHNNHWIEFENIRVNVFKDSRGIRLPTIVTGSKDGYKLTFRSEPTNDEFILDLGYGNYESVTVNSMTMKTSGKLHKNGKEVFSFKDIPTRSWFSNLNVRKLFVRQAMNAIFVR